MGYIPEDQINRVKDAVDIVDIISGYLELKPSGANYKGLCPFHHEKTPSFMVNQQRNSYHCFGCGEGGDAISFIMKLENLDYVGAIKFLADKLGIIIEENEYNKEAAETRERFYKINSLTAKFYFKNMLTEKIPQQYIFKRGLDIKVVNTFFLGYAQNGSNLYEFLKSQKVDVEDMIKLGLVGRSKDGNSYYDKFRDRLIFPILNNKQKVIGFGGRTLVDSNIKYLNSPESEVFYKGDNLYGVNILQSRRNRDKVVLVEGYMDVIGLYNQGIDFATASLGTALTENQAKLVKRYGNNVFIAYDSDTAGIKATLRAIDIFEKIDVEPKIVEFPDSMDPDEYILKYGVQSFNKLLDSAKKALDYKLDLEISKGGDKIALTERMINFLTSIKGNAKREIYAKKISNSIDISFDSLYEDVQQRLENQEKKENFITNKSKFSDNNGYDSSQRENRNIEVNVISKDYLRVRLEKELISKSLINKEFFEILKDKSKEFVSSPSLLSLYNYIEEEYRKNSQIAFEELYKSECFINSGVKESNDFYNDEVDQKKVSSICEELINRVDLFQLQDRQEEIFNLLKGNLTNEEKIPLIRELVELNEKLTQ